MRAKKVVFIETPVFTAQVTKQISDEEYADLQNFLAAQPEAGSLIPGSGGARKIRWRDPGRGKGKRGGVRMIYFYRDRHDQIIMLFLFDKNQQDNLTTDQKKQLKAVIKNWR